MYDVPEFKNAACAETDPEVFFPKTGDMRGSRKAKAICRGCPELLVCREYAISHADIVYGIWGGLTSYERQRLRNGYERAG